jgi:hypothetical protein
LKNNINEVEFYSEKEKIFEKIILNEKIEGKFIIVNNKKRNG